MTEENMLAKIKETSQTPKNKRSKAVDEMWDEMDQGDIDQGVTPEELEIANQLANEASLGLEASMFNYANNRLEHGPEPARSRSQSY